MTPIGDPVDPDGSSGGIEVPATEIVVEPHWANIPNAFTFLRVLLVPVILWLLTLDGEPARWWAFGVFVFAAATDAADGWVARRFHGVTQWGAFADPLADKLLVIGALTSLAIVGEAPWWTVVLILAREVLVTAMRVRLVQGLRLVLPASIWGKVKTVTQIVAVSALLLPPMPPRSGEVLLYLAVLATLVSGAVYWRDIQRVRSTGSLTT